MNNSTIAPATKLRRGSEHYLNGKPVYIERDKGDGTVLITDSKERLPGDNYWNINKSDLKQQCKVNSKIQAKGLAPDKISDKADLNTFFKSLEKDIPFGCMCCRKPLYALNKQSRRGVCCHILPKAKFKSIAMNRDNILFMGVYVFGSSCDDHSIWDSSVERRVKMPIYELALKRYTEKLKPLLTKREIILADEYLGITIKSGNLTKDVGEGRV